MYSKMFHSKMNNYIIRNLICIKCTSYICNKLVSYETNLHIRTQVYWWKVHILIWHATVRSVRSNPVRQYIDVVKQTTGCGNEVFQPAIVDGLVSYCTTITDRHRLLVRYLGETSE